jgi:proline iminopeptidase
LASRHTALVSSLTRAESRAIVDGLRRTGRLRTVRAVLRPHGVTWFWRSRAPLWIQLVLAELDGRLFRDGNAVAVYERPQGGGSRGSTWLHRLDRQWDLVWLVLPAVALFAVAIALAVAAGPGWSPTLLAALVLVVLAPTWWCVVMTAGIARMVGELVRRRPVATAVSQLRAHNPTVVLLHAPTAQAATTLVSQVVGDADGTVVILIGGVTAAEPERDGSDGLRVEPLSGAHPVLVARRPADPPPGAPSGPGRFRGRDTAVILGGSTAVLAVVAWFVAESERATCGTNCADAVTSYGDALYWMGNRLFGGDPENLGVSSLFSRLIAVLVTVYGLYVLVAIVGAVVRQRIDDDLRSAADVVAAYEKGRGAGTEGYPPSEPHAHGLLDVGDGQHVYWETCGSPHGAPAVVLHGGPGSGAGQFWTRLLDPAAYRIILLDQRGCGRSIPDVADPTVSLETNTTPHLVADLERLRTHLAVERWLVLGASWGSTLALAYAQRHPRSVSAMVLFSVCGTTRDEVEWITRGMRRYLPAEWERFRDAAPPADRDGDLASAYARMLASPDPDVRELAAREWCAWEERHVAAVTAARPDPRFTDPAVRMRFARLVTHYWSNAAWLEDDELVRGARSLAGIPAVLVHGRADISSPPEFAHRLHRAWPGSELVLINGAGHGANADLIRVVVAATHRFRSHSSPTSL